MEVLTKVEGLPWWLRLRWYQVAKMDLREKHLLIGKVSKTGVMKDVAYLCTSKVDLVEIDDETTVIGWK
jgi:hypothetical protein